MKQKRQFWTIILTCVMVLIIGQTAMAANYQENRKGSITLNLAVPKEDKTVPIPGISLSVYKVATADTEGAIRFVLDERLTDAGVDLTKLDTPEKVQTAADKLAARVKDSGVPVISNKTDRNGKAYYGNLEKGMYLVVQGDGEKVCAIAPMLLSIPYSKDGVDWDFDIEASLKAEKKENPGTLDVEKRVIFKEDGKWVEKNVKAKTYYVGLFLDEEATIPFGDVKKISIQDHSRGTATFTELPEGTYYLRETDSKGKAYPVNKEFKEEDGSKVNCVVTVENEQTTRIAFADGEGGNKNAVVENRYPDEKVPPVKTGDEASPILWIGIAALAVIVAAAAILLKKKKEN